MKRITFVQRNRTFSRGLEAPRHAIITMRSTFLLLLASSFLLYSGCQYNISGNPDVNLLAVHISPDSAAVPTNGSLVLTASIKDFLHEGTVTWSIQEPSAGTIVSNGLTATYIAPAGLSLSLSVVHIRLSADEDPTRYVVCPVTIALPKDADTLFEASPQTVWMLTNDPQRSITQQFTIDTVTTNGTPIPPVRWSIVSGPGDISSSGLYTPPATVTDSTFVTVRASSAQDASIYSEATIVLHNYTDSLLCFSRDILPILSGSCGTSGCHDASSNKGN
jgi:hypothetical protein